MQARKLKMDNILDNTLEIYLATTYKKMYMPDSQRYPWNLSLIKNTRDILVFSLLKLLIVNLNKK